MTKPELRILAPEDLVWPHDNSGPLLYMEAEWPHPVHVDPYPGYTHDPDVVREEIERVHRAWPLPVPVTYYVAPFEGVNRFNGLCNNHECYEYDDKKPEFPWTTTIWLSGKRVPPHPAMTRYLVAHEYGHAVERHMEQLRGLPARKDDKLMREYATARGIEFTGRGNYTWHSSLSEVFACDFRILVANVEREFWPHPGIFRSDDDTRNADLVTWWLMARTRMVTGK